MNAIITEPGRGLMVRVAGLLGCTEGQAYTALIGVALAVTASLFALPPADGVRGLPTAGGNELASAPVPPAGTDTPVEAPPDPPSAPPPALVAEPPTGEVPVDPITPEVPPPSVGPTPAFIANGFGAADVMARVGPPGAPEGIAVDRTGRVYVATNNGVARGGPGASKVMRFGPGGRLEKQLTVQGQSAARTNGLTGLTITTDGSVLALDTAPARVLRLDLDRGRQETHATLPDVPGLDGPAQPRSLTVAPGGVLFVTDSGQGMIWRISTDGTAEPWHVFAKSEATSATGITLDANGDILVVASTPLQGSVYRIDVQRDGTAGTRTTLVTLEPLAGPAGISATPGGGMVVAMASSNELVLLGPDGAEQARLTAEEVAQHADVPLDGPTGVVASGRSLLVTNQSPRANDESHWVVFDIELTT
jgi:hypothetical protein